MAASIDLWSACHDLFDDDDGSLPEVVFAISDPATADEAYRLLQSFSSGFSHRFARYWSAIEQRDVEIRWSDLASEILRKADGAWFHVILGGVKSTAGRSVPDLGVGIGKNQLSLDYRMGVEWSREVMTGFLEVLEAVMQVLGATEFGHEANQKETADDDRLLNAWKSWTVARQGGAA